MLGLHNKPKAVVHLVHKLTGGKKKKKKTIFSDTLSFLSSHNASDQVSHPYKTTSKI
jgi:hypothetical protein